MFPWSRRSVGFISALQPVAIIAPTMIMPAVKLALGAIWAPHRFLEVIDDWGDDAFDFLRHQVPRIVAVLVIAFVLSRLLKLVSRHLGELSNRQDLPSSVRSQQLRTLSSVIYSVGVIVIILSPRCRSCLCWGSTWDHCWPALGSPASPSVSARRRWSRISSTASSSWRKTNTTLETPS